MARIHILDSPKAGEYNGVAHFLPPLGSNKVGTTWKAVLLAHYPNPEPAAGDAAEKAAIVAGDIIEIPLRIQLEPEDMTGAKLQAALEKVAAHTISEWLREPQRRYRYYGYSQGDVT